MVLANEQEIHPDVDELYSAQGNAAGLNPQLGARERAPARRLTASPPAPATTAAPAPDYSSSHYAAFLLDPDGNNVEAVHT